MPEPLDHSGLAKQMTTGTRRRGARPARFGALLLGAGLLLTSAVVGPALAKDPMNDGFYVRLVGLGAVSVLDDVENKGSAFGSLNDPDEDTDLVGGVGAAIGYSFEPGDLGGISLELMYDHRFRYDYDVNPAFSGAPTVSISSDLSSNVLMFNALFQFDVDWPLGEGNVYPYVGGGVGAAWHHSDADFTNVDTAVSVDAEEDSTNLAGSGNFGFIWQLKKGWDIGLGYRFIYLGEVPIGDFDGVGTGVDIEAETYISHDILLTIGYHF